MDNTPLISLIIPVHNDEKYISKCLDSIIFQTLPDIEIICVDDASVDASLNILLEYQSNDSRIRLIQNGNNLGTYLARKTAALSALGKFVMFVDADDMLDKDACRALIEIAERHPADIIQFTADVVNCTGDEEAKIFYKHYMHTVESQLNSSKDILNMFFVSRTNIASVWGKLYSTSLVKTAYSQMPDFFSCIGEDTFTQFLFAYYSESYISVETQPYYFYHYGLGISNQAKKSSEMFKAICDMGHLVHVAEDFLHEHDVYEEYRTYCDAMGLRMAEDVCRAYQNLSDDCDGEECGRYLAQTWQGIPSMDKAFSKAFKYPFMKFKASMLHGHKIVLDNRDIDNVPKVSVIIPIYNVEKYLKECLDSVVNQTLRDIEIICIDDGSTDNSLEIAKEYCDDKRVILLSQPNKGLSSARNLGLKYARGEYVHFLDSDDFMLSEAYETLYEQADKQELDMLCFSSSAFCNDKDVRGFVENYNTPYKYKNNISITSGERLYCIFQKAHVNFASACLTMYKRSYLNELGVSFIEGIIHEDEAFTFEVMLSARRVAYTTSAFYTRRIRVGSTMTEPKSTNNLRGYLSAYFYMCSFAVEKCFCAETQNYIDIRLENTRKSICNIYAQLPDLYDYLSEYELTILGHLCCGESESTNRPLIFLKQKVRKFTEYSNNYGIKSAVVKSLRFIKRKTQYLLLQITK